MAVFADFGNGMGLTKAPRDERRVQLRMIPDLREEGPRLGPRPQLLHRVSPLADEQAPLPEHDTATARAKPFEWSGEQGKPVPMPSRWPVNKFSEWSQDYPDERARDVGLAVLRTGVDSFVGIEGRL